MRFTLTSVALFLAALPFAAAAPSKAGKHAANHASPFVVYTQVNNITQPARNTSGVLVNVVHGSIKPFEEEFGAASTIDWKNKKSVGGSWNFGSGKLGGGSGGWSFNATTFEYGGGVALNSNRTQANYLVQANTDGSIKMTFFTLQDMKCTTTPATRGELAKTECTVPASGHRSKDRAHHHRSSAHQPRAECGDGNDC